MKYLLFFLIFLSTDSFANELYRLPQGTQFTTPLGIMRGYTIDEFKILLKMDTDLKIFEESIKDYKKIIVNLETMLGSKTEQIKLANIQLGVVEKDRNRIFEKWKEENKSRHTCENKPKWGSWVAWGSASVAAVAAIVLGIVLGTK